jgi:hypothetical protein
MWRLFPCSYPAFRKGLFKAGCFSGDRAGPAGRAWPDRVVARETSSMVMGTAKTSTSALNMGQHGTCQKSFQA